METISVVGTQNKKGQVFTDPRVMMNEAPRTASFYTGSEVSPIRSRRKAKRPR
jgi:pyruvate ferredoxin oxidoreductase alpha subunit